MRLLFITQKADTEDPVLGFVHGWISEFAKTFESISVVCLEKGKTNFPGNVTVASLGKENGASRIMRVLNFFRFIVGLRDQYDGVFVHMNPEYVVLGGLFWKLFGKKIVLWYNHGHRDQKLRIAMRIADIVCYTSEFAASSGSHKSRRMPVGIDMDVFANEGGPRVPGSLLSLGRIAPVKHVDTIVRAAAELLDSGVAVSLTVVGDALPKDTAYFREVSSLARAGVAFEKAVGDRNVVAALYNQHEYFINASPAGLFDKTVFEAISCGCMPIVSSKAFRGLVPDECFFEEGDAESLASTVRNLLVVNGEKRTRTVAELRRRIVSEHSLTALSAQIRGLYL